MTVKFTNNVKTKVAVSVATGITVIVVEDVSRFPTLGPGEYTYCTLTDTAKPDQTEICEVTSINSAQNELTVIRGKEGTAQQSWRVGSNCELRLTAELLTRAIQDGAPDWDSIEGIPDTFPPEYHTHEQYLTDANSDGKQYTRQDGAWSEVAFPEVVPPSWDEVTGKPTEFPPSDHTHPEFDELGDRIDAIEDAITEDGGFVDAPDDGKLYGRQSEDWAEVVIPDVVDPDWDSITGKPTEFPPEDHTHVVADITDFDPTDYQPAGDYLTDADSDGKQYARQDGAWAEVIAGGGDGNAAIISDTAPENATEGDLWFCSLVGSEGFFCFSDDPNGGEGYWFEVSTPSKGGDGNGDDNGASVDLSNYVQKPSSTDSWMVYKDGWAPVTTDLVLTNSDIAFRDSKGRFKSTREVPELNNQLEVNRWFYEQLESIPEDVDLTGYATETYVDNSIAAIEPLWEQNGDDIYYNDGNIGVGTDDPSQKLTISDVSAPVYISQNRGNVSSLVGPDGADGGLYIGTTSDHEVRMHTSGERRLTIDTAGNVGIGTSSPHASSLLHLFPSDGDANLRIQSSVTGSAKAKIQLLGRDSSNVNATWEIINDNHSLDFVIDDSSKVTINEQGKVGIGTDDPKRELDVIGTAQAQDIRIDPANPGVQPARLRFYGSTNPAGESGFTIRDQDVGSDRLVISPAGNVGINMNPIDSGAISAKLQVSGKISSDWQVCAGADNPQDGPPGARVHNQGTVYAYRELGDVSVWRGFGDGAVTSKIQSNGDATFNGTVYANGSPLTRTRDLVTTLSALRNATMDETQDIRESLRSAIDELVAGFEQEIATMPAPEAGE